MNQTKAFKIVSRHFEWHGSSDILKKICQKSNFDKETLSDGSRNVTCVLTHYPFLDFYGCNLQL